MACKHRIAVSVTVFKINYHCICVFIPQKMLQFRICECVTQFLQVLCHPAEGEGETF